MSPYDQWKLATPPEYEEEVERDEREPEYEYDDAPEYDDDLERCDCYGCATMRYPCIKELRS